MPVVSIHSPMVRSSATASSAIHRPGQRNGGELVVRDVTEPALRKLPLIVSCQIARWQQDMATGVISMEAWSTLTGASRPCDSPDHSLALAFSQTCRSKSARVLDTSQLPTFGWDCMVSRQVSKEVAHWWRRGEQSRMSRVLAHGDTGQGRTSSFRSFFQLPATVHGIGSFDSPAWILAMDTANSTLLRQRRLRVTINQTRFNSRVAQSARGHLERLAAHPRFCNSAPEVDSCQFWENTNGNWGHWVGADNDGITSPYEVASD
ncbi:hypothetical protein H4582DRAFT_2059290 [Lactarius indigo]|nr:hypothetical protein H4582DRAFT_2059290 [Lactarius indigo]